MIKKCEICGKEFQTIPNGGNRKYCFDCVPLNLTESKRTVFKRQALKKEGVKRLGGKCLKCGESRPHVLHFHHVNPENKLNNPSKLLANSQTDAFFKEIKKCILLCANCHEDFHYLHDNCGIDLDTYLNQEVSTIYEEEVKEVVTLQQENLSKLQEIQIRQDKLMSDRPVKKIIYKGPIIAFLDNWVQEFDTVDQCAIYLDEKLHVGLDNARDGIRRVLNGKRKTYHKYGFEKSK